MYVCQEGDSEEDRRADGTMHATEKSRIRLPQSK